MQPTLIKTIVDRPSNFVANNEKAITKKNSEQQNQNLKRSVIQMYQQRVTQAC